jgi:hypothetical protein
LPPPARTAPDRTEETERQRVPEADGMHVASSRLSDRKVADREGAAETRVRVALGRPERMFA